MNIDRMPVRQTPQTEKVRTPRPAGPKLAQEMLVNMAIGGDSQQTRKLLERAVLQAVTEHFKLNPKPYLDVLKEPPFKVELNNPNTPGLANLAQRVLDILSQNPEWKKAIRRAKDTALETQKPLGPELGDEVYALLADATTDAIRKIAADQSAGRPEA